MFSCYNKKKNERENMQKLKNKALKHDRQTDGQNNVQMRICNWNNI